MQRPEYAHREYEFGSAVYGSILVSALVGAMFEEHATAQTMTLSLVGSIVIFWVAHAWSEVIGERVATGRLFESSRIRTIAVSEWPLVEAGMLPRCCSPTGRGPTGPAGAPSSSASRPTATTSLPSSSLSPRSRMTSPGYAMC